MTHPSIFAEYGSAEATQKAIEELDKEIQEVASIAGDVLTYTRTSAIMMNLKKYRNILQHQLKLHKDYEKEWRA